MVILKNQRIRSDKHVWRIGGQHIQTVKKWRPNKIRPRGRPRQQWKDQVKDLKILRVNNGDELGKTGVEWKKIIEKTMRLNNQKKLKNKINK